MEKERGGEIEKHGGQREGGRWDRERERGRGEVKGADVDSEGWIEGERGGR